MATAQGSREVFLPTSKNKDANKEINVQAYKQEPYSQLSTRHQLRNNQRVRLLDLPGRWCKVSLEMQKNPCDKFEPSTGAAKVHAKQAFHQLKLASADEDPDPWITSLELKHQQLKTLGSTIEDDDMIRHILNNLPKEFETVVELCEEDLSRGTESS